MGHSTALFLSLFLAFGCGLQKLAVSNADMILRYQIEKRLPLSAPQKKELPQDIDHFLNQNKQIAKDLISIIKEIDLNPEKADQQYDELNLLYQKLASSFFALISKPMSQFDKKQQAELINIFKVEEEKLSKITDDERRTKITERMEYFFGDIKKDQRVLFSELLNEWDLRHREHLERKRKLQEKIIFTIGQVVTEAEKEKNLNFVLNEYVTSYPAANKNKQIIKRIIYSIHPDQKEHFKKRIEDVVEIIKYFQKTDY